MERLKKLAKGAWELSGSLPYLRLILLAAVLVLSVILFYNCGSAPSQNEIDLKEKTGEVIEQKAETNVAAQEVKTKEAEVKVSTERVKAARTEANKAVKAAEEKRNVNSGDVSYEDANRSRCRAYPEDKECQ